MWYSCCCVPAGVASAASAWLVFIPCVVSMLFPRSFYLLLSTFSHFVQWLHNKCSREFKSFINKIKCVNNSETICVFFSNLNLKYLSILFVRPPTWHYVRPEWRLHITLGPKPNLCLFELYKVAKYRFGLLFCRTMSSQVRQNFHQDCEAAINRQINLELYASYVYLSMVRIQQMGREPSSGQLSKEVDWAKIKWKTHSGSGNISWCELFIPLLLETVFWEVILISWCIVYVTDMLVGLVSILPTHRPVCQHSRKSCGW